MCSYESEREAYERRHEEETASHRPCSERVGRTYVCVVVDVRNVELSFLFLFFFFFKSSFSFFGGMSRAIKRGCPTTCTAAATATATATATAAGMEPGRRRRRRRGMERRRLANPHREADGPDSRRRVDTRQGRVRRGRVSEAGANFFSSPTCASWRTQADHSLHTRPAILTSRTRLYPSHHADRTRDVNCASHILPEQQSIRVLAGWLAEHSRLLSHPLSFYPLPLSRCVRSPGASLSLVEHVTSKRGHRGKARTKPKRHHSCTPGECPLPSHPAVLRSTDVPTGDMRHPIDRLLVVCGDGGGCGAQPSCSSRPSLLFIIIIVVVIVIGLPIAAHR